MACIAVVIVVVIIVVVVVVVVAVEPYFSTLCTPSSTPTAPAQTLLPGGCRARGNKFRNIRRVTGIT